MAKSNVSSVVNYIPTVNEGFTTTLGSTITSGATTVPLADVTGLTNGTIFVGIIEPGATNEQVFTGTVDTGGSQLTGVVWTRGTNVGHIGGVSIVDYVTGTAFNMIAAGFLKQHTQTGAHGVITATSLAATGNGSFGGTLGVTGVLTPTGGLSTNSVSAAALATNAITLGYAQITSNFTGVTSTTGTQVTGLTATVTIPAGTRRVFIEAYTSDVFTATGAAQVILSLWDGTVGSGTQIGRGATVCATAGSPYFVAVRASVTPSAGSKTYNVGLATSNASNTANLEAAAAYPAYILVTAI